MEPQLHLIRKATELGRKAWDDWLAGMDYASGPRCSSAGAPDLVVSSVDPTEMTLVAGGSADTVAFTILNAGDGAADSTTATVYQSDDSTITTNDWPIVTGAVPGLAASDSTALRITLNAPAGMSARVVYVGMCVASVSGESDADNNCSNAVTLNIVSSAAADFWGRDAESAPRRLVVTVIPEVPESIGGR